MFASLAALLLVLLHPLPSDASGSGDEETSSGSGSYDGDFASGSGDDPAATTSPAIPPSAPPPPSPPPYWSPPSPHVPFDDLVSPALCDHLRSGDRRMVRPSPSSVTKRLRAEAYALNRIDSVIEELTRNVSTHGVDLSLPMPARAKAAEAVTLFVADSPPNRARFGAAPGVLAALVALVDRAWRDAVAYDPEVSAPHTDAKFDAAEAAAEAIWILSFNSPSNHRRLVRELGAVEALAGMVTARDALGVRTPSRAAMWAMAALQNLAASYCNTLDGRCTWRYVRGAPSRLEATTEITIDAEEARQRIARQPGVVDALVGYACEGPVGVADGGDAPWPSKANVESRNAPSVAPWAAAGALKNLALSEHVVRGWLLLADGRLDTMRRCLCRLARSRDWLESSKAGAALGFLRPRAAAGVEGDGFGCEQEEEEDEASRRALARGNLIKAEL